MRRRSSWPEKLADTQKCDKKFSSRCRVFSQACVRFWVSFFLLLLLSFPNCLPRYSLCSSRGLRFDSIRGVLLVFVFFSSSRAELGKFLVALGKHKHGLVSQKRHYKETTQMPLFLNLHAVVDFLSGSFRTLSGFISVFLVFHYFFSDAYSDALMWILIISFSLFFLISHASFLTAQREI